MGNYQDEFVLFDNDMTALLEGLRMNGVVSGLGVTQSSPPGLSVLVAPGVYRANGVRISKAGSTTVAIPAADPAYPRKDIIVADQTGAISVVSGTPASPSPALQRGPKTAQPRPPDIPAGKVILAEVWVAAGAAQIVNADITDRRVLIPLEHGALEGLADDDHGQYLKEKGSGGLSSEVPEHSHQSPEQCGILDHGLALSGLGDDDHAQYLNNARHDTPTRHPKAVIAGAPAGDYVGTTDPQELSQKVLNSPKIKDVDPAPVGDLLLKVLKEVLHIRNAADTADKQIAGQAKARFVSGLGDHSHQSAGAEGGQLDHGLALAGLADDDHPQYLDNARHDIPDRHPLGTVVPHDSLASLTEREHASLTGIGPDDHHPQLHAASHESGGGDVVAAAKIRTVEDTVEPAPAEGEVCLWQDTTVGNERFWLIWRKGNANRKVELL